MGSISHFRGREPIQDTEDITAISLWSFRYPLSPLRDWVPPQVPCLSRKLQNDPLMLRPCYLRINIRHLQLWALKFRGCPCLTLAWGRERESPQRAFATGNNRTAWLAMTSEGVTPRTWSGRPTRSRRPDVRILRRTDAEAAKGHAQKNWELRVENWELRMGGFVLLFTCSLVHLFTCSLVPVPQKKI